MEFKELIKVRQSDRKYQQIPVEEEKINLCIEAARLAPSACNAQPWKFIVVNESKLRETIAEHSASLGMNKFVAEASVIVVIILEKPNLTSKIGSVLKDKEYTLMDIGIVANQFCLQAADLGLGTCMVGWFNEKKIRKALQVPSSRRIPLLITVGYSDSPTREKTRKKTEEMSSKNQY